MMQAIATINIQPLFVPIVFAKESNICLQKRAHIMLYPTSSVVPYLNSNRVTLKFPNPNQLQFVSRLFYHSRICIPIQLLRNSLTKPIVICELTFLPFMPQTMTRPWTVKTPLKKSPRKIKLFDSLNPGNNSNSKELEILKPQELGNFVVKLREEVLWKPLSRSQRLELVKPQISSNRASQSQ